MRSAKSSTYSKWRIPSSAFSFAQSITQLLATSAPLSSSSNSKLLSGSQNVNTMRKSRDRSPRARSSIIVVPTALHCLAVQQQAAPLTLPPRWRIRCRPNFSSESDLKTQENRLRTGAACTWHNLLQVCALLCFIIVLLSYGLGEHRSPPNSEGWGGVHCRTHTRRQVPWTT